MKLGKLSHQELQKLVLDRLPEQANTVTCGPSVGLDCAAIRFGDGQVILSSDPITGAASEVGRLAIHISCNDIAACGIRPSAMMLVIIAPPHAKSEDIQLVMDQAAATARKLNISIVGGHTEISDAVKRFVIITTAIGFTYGGRIIQAGGAKPGDTILMTKTAGLEGTAILAGDQGKRLEEKLSSQELRNARAMIDQISVVEEGTCGSNQGVSAMHDATEGGILGACWEVAQASGLGCIIRPRLIPVHPITEKICQVLSLDPLRLIASGSMIMSTGEPELLIESLAAKDIRCIAIGELTENQSRILDWGDKQEDLLPPQADELYKII